MKVGDRVYLKNDSNREVFKIVEKLGMSKGPVGQFKASRVWRVQDKRNGVWEFREDSLKKLDRGERYYI